MKCGPTDSKALGVLRAAILDHYDRNARDLPWRRSTDPYRVLVSEVMLQQTRVETVRGYYGRWLERFPTVEALAGASEDEVLKAWEGLGYYRRARNLHRAATVVREKHGGEIPGAYSDLRALPGVGDYTAGAVASIAFGERVPAVDGNVRRLFARLWDQASPTPSWLRKQAAELVDPDRPGDWNQALMELGATVCTPGSPRCGECPVADWCSALDAGTQLLRPSPPRRAEVPRADIVLALLHHEGQVLLEKRPSGGLLGGMWALPERRVSDGAPDGGGEEREASPGGGAEVALALAEAMGQTPTAEPTPLPPCRHRFTHLRANYLPWAVEVAPGGEQLPARAAWVDPADPGARALPKAQWRVLASWREPEATGKESR